MYMKINSTETTFQSRNQTIRFADDIARRVNQCYPRVSASNFSDMKNIDYFKRMEINLTGKLSDMREDKLDKLFKAKTLKEMLLAIVEPIKESKVGNCGESAELSAIAAKANGIKDCYIVNIKGEYDNDLDHMVLYVNDKKPYIIDAWLGFADYVPNAVNRYKSEFSRHFDKDSLNYKFVFAQKEDGYDYFLDYKFSDNNVALLRRLFPELVIKKSS